MLAVNTGQLALHYSDWPLILSLLLKLVSVSTWHWVCFEETTERAVNFKAALLILGMWIKTVRKCVAASGIDHCCWNAWLLQATCLVSRSFPHLNRPLESYSWAGMAPFSEDLFLQSKINHFLYVCVVLILLSVYVLLIFFSLFPH